MIRFENVRKSFRQGGKEVVALRDVSLEIPAGQFVSIMGPSGSGKSTLLHLAGGMDLPSAGLIFVDGGATSKMSDDDLTLTRRRKIGFVFQFFNLMPTLTVEENVALPLLLEGKNLVSVRDRVRALVERVGLTDRLTHHPEELSGGEMQRASIARALVHEPPLLLADEPTGNLDSSTGKGILDLLRDIHEEGKHTIVMVTHDLAAAEYGNRQLRIHDGKAEG